MLSDSFSVLPPPIKTRCWQGVIHVTDGPEYFPYALKKKFEFTVYRGSACATVFFFSKKLSICSSCLSYVPEVTGRLDRTALFYKNLPQI